MLFTKEYKPWKKVRTYFAIIPVNIYGDIYVWGEKIYRYTDHNHFKYFGRKKDYRNKREFYLKEVCEYSTEEVEVSECLRNMKN